MKKNDFIGNSFITNNSKETQRLGKEFSRTLEGGDVVALFGELGAGKTTFVQGVAEGLEIKNRIISPTFVIIRKYKLKDGNFYHIDLYRTEGQDDIESLGFEEIVNNKKNIVVIEWAEKLKGTFPQKRINVEFSYQRDSVRKIAFGSLNQ